MLTLDDAASDLLAASCLCAGTRQLHVGSAPVPCPDCGDV